MGLDLKIHIPNYDADSALQIFLSG